MLKISILILIIAIATSECWGPSYKTVEQSNWLDTLNPVKIYEAIENYLKETVNKLKGS